MLHVMCLNLTALMYLLTLLSAWDEMDQCIIDTALRCTRISELITEI